MKQLSASVLTAGNLAEDAAPITELGWCAVRFTGANAPVYKYLNPKGLKRHHLYYPSFYFVQ